MQSPTQIEKAAITVAVSRTSEKPNAYARNSMKYLRSAGIQARLPRRSVWNEGRN